MQKNIVIKRRGEPTHFIPEEDLPFRQRHFEAGGKKFTVRLRVKKRKSLRNHRPNNRSD